MHSCKETKAQITELLLDAADYTPDTMLSSELLKCADCRYEFATLKATLRTTTRSLQLSAPTEDYWTSYEAKLRHKLVNSTAATNSHGPSLVTRFFRFSIPVPAPVALALVILSAVFIPVAIRTARRQQTAPPPSVVERTIQVPVVQEKIVTQVVYRDRQPVALNSKQPRNVARVESTFAKSRDTDSPATLAGFKPTDEVKLTVIKGGSTNEK